MNTSSQLTHYRIDDLPLVLGMLMQMSIPHHYEHEMGDHGLHQGLSGGWMMTIWLAFILTQADHTKYKVEDWVARHHFVIEKLTGQPVVAQQFNDNKLSSLLSRLSCKQRWEEFEASLWRDSVELYQLCPASLCQLKSAHVDSTTAYGHHTISEEALMQKGHSKDHRPDLAQLKLMTVAFFPSGHLAATEVVNGNRADDGLYLPIIARARQMLGQKGVLYCGDGKMAALETRAEIARFGDYYLTVAPLTGQIAKLLPTLIESVIGGEQKTEVLTNEEGERVGRGFEFERQMVAKLPREGGQLEDFSFSERVQVIQSNSLVEQQKAGLEKRLDRAKVELMKLTPKPKQGQRQYQDEESLLEAITKVMASHKVKGLLEVKWKLEQKSHYRFVGRGHHSADSPKQEVIKKRYVITSVKRDQKAILEQEKRMGWRVQLSNAPSTIGLNACFNHYRSNWRGERNYNRLKSDPIGIDPLFVQNDDQIRGLTHLLSIAVRVETIIEWQVAQGLKKEGKQMKGLYAGQPKQATSTPTAVAMLQAISRAEITVTRLEHQGQSSWFLTQLPDLLLDLLGYLNLPLTLYNGLVSSSVFDFSFSRK
jgi:transposase